MKKILLVFAHPDDESFSAGGTVAKYVKAGWRVDLICATRGEAGQSGVYGNETGEKLGKIRQKEVEKAGAILGISSITFLGYMDGTLSDEHPGELEDKIYNELIKHIPDCVITFNTTGVSNHPDHIKMCYATTFAFQKYAAWVRGQLVNSLEFKEEHEPKLYYACMPESVVAYMKKNKILPEESFGKPWRGTPDKHITTVINISGFQNIKKKALLSHISQRIDVNRSLSFGKNPLAHQEYFLLRLHGIREVFMGKKDRVSNRL
jgi:N-acetylglucosamine malate deacetylase 2